MHACMVTKIDRFILYFSSFCGKSAHNFPVWSDKKTYAVTDRSGYTNEKWWSTRDEIFQLN